MSEVPGANVHGTNDAERKTMIHPPSGPPCPPPAKARHTAASDFEEKLKHLDGQYEVIDWNEVQREQFAPLTIQFVQAYPVMRALLARMNEDVNLLAAEARASRLYRDATVWQREGCEAIDVAALAHKTAMKAVDESPTASARVERGAS